MSLVLSCLPRQIAVCRGFFSRLEVCRSGHAPHAVALPAIAGTESECGSGKSSRTFGKSDARSGRREVVQESENPRKPLKRAFAFHQADKGKKISRRNCGRMTCIDRRSEQVYASRAAADLGLRPRRGYPETSIPQDFLAGLLHPRTAFRARSRSRPGGDLAAAAIGTAAKVLSTGLWTPRLVPGLSDHHVHHRIAVMADVGLQRDRHS